MCQFSVSSLWRNEKANHIINGPPFELEDIFITNERSRIDMHQKYILLHEEGVLSVWISTLMVKMGMETRIDQINIS